VSDVGNGRVTTIPRLSSGLAFFMVTNRTGMEIGIVTTTAGLAFEKDGSRGKDNNGFQLPNYKSIFLLNVVWPRRVPHSVTFPIACTINANCRRLGD
jgi:hypothetical protein